MKILKILVSLCIFMSIAISALFAEMPAGMEVDDIILEVNGRNSTNIDTGEMYQMRFDSDIKELLLKVQKPGSDEIKEILLKKEYLM